MKTGWKVSDQSLAFVLLRLALGINIFVHGLGRMGANFEKFYDWILELFKNAPLPEVLVAFSAYLIPIAELVIGFLLILGLFTRLSLVAGTLLMIVLMFGMCLLGKWEIVGLQMLYILLYVGLISQMSHNALAVDGLIVKKGDKR